MIGAATTMVVVNRLDFLDFLGNISDTVIVEGRFEWRLPCLSKGGCL